MKSIKNLLKAITTATLLAGLTINFNACSEQSPFAPEKNEQGFKILKVVQPRLNKEFQASKVIGVWGGTISVGDSQHGISRLIVPPLAVSDDVQIDFWWESTGFLEGGADFSPHGTEFNIPVTLVLSYKDADLSGVNEDDLEIRYYNEQTSEWELVGDIVNKNNKTVIGFTDHFSRYAIGAE